MLPLILASQSPRRADLLEEAGYEFKIIKPSPTAECGICSRESAPEMVARLATQKAEDVAKNVPSGLVIGCDTVAECMGQILGKPHNREHAEEMLQLMRGRVHHVYSGLCLWHRPTDEKQVEVEATRLKMHDFSDEALADHLNSDLWIGKAGAFGFQDGLDWVEIEAGSESNVVGLPMELLQRMLARFSTE